MKFVHYLNQVLGEIKEAELGLIERTYYYQSKVWYHFILLEMKECFESAVRWLELFKMEGRYIQRDTNQMMRAYHYILTTLYHLGDSDKYEAYLSEFENYRKDNYSKFNKNTQIISFIYVHNGRLNKYILIKNYHEGLKVIPKTLARIKRYRKNLDSHRILVLHYKIAMLYIMAGKAEKAIKFLYNILNNKLGNLREDIQGFAKIAFLMAHYDIENYDVVERELRPVKKYFSKNSFGPLITELILPFFSKIISVPFSQRREVFREFFESLNTQFENKYKRRTILYLNILEWVEKNLKNLS